MSFFDVSRKDLDMWRERRVEPVSTSTFTDDSGAILAMVVELTCTAAAVAIVLAACDS